MPGLRAHDARKVEIGNVIMKASVSIARSCLQSRVPVVLENPATSRLWLAPPMQNLLQHPRVHTVVLDYCAYGT
eukprot:3908760-Lingulodinium_polyedra.AAC.1